MSNPANLPEVAPKPALLPAWLRAMRPKQWVKNVLVLAAPVAAGRLFETPVLIATLWAFVGFSLVSASIYLINDSRDIEADRLHPTKRFRPIAAGELSSNLAYVLAAITAAAAFAIGFWVAPTDATQGESYRIIYIHVASAWMSMFLYVVMAFWAAIGAASKMGVLIKGGATIHDEVGPKPTDRQWGRQDLAALLGSLGDPVIELGQRGGGGHRDHRLVRTADPVGR